MDGIQKRYRQELKGEEASAALGELKAVKNKRVTLLFAAKDEEHNNAVVLRELLA